MLTVSELRDRIAHEFPDVRQVSDTAVRFSRVLGEKAYAVCYVDVAEKLPDTAEALTRYQDHIIGQYYFEGPRSLQWSNYLYFLQPPEALETKAALEAKHLIEADRTYARKFVLGEDEFNDVLAPYLIETPQVGDRTNVMATWAQKLTQPGLRDAVFKDLAMPRRLGLIEKPNANQPPRAPEAPVAMDPSHPPPFIKEFKIKKYRPYPTRPDYKFGTVNLIVGANAVGKTSLLEAIELYYCGRTKRNPNANEGYAFRVVLADGKIDPATDSRPQRTFRESNLLWYGQHELKTNTLYRSFSLYNFLDTDAAVSISESTDDLEDNLSRLLVGPDASNVWRNIERLSEALEARVREVTTRFTENRVERDRIAAQLEAEQNLPQESDAIKARLDAMMRKLKWQYPAAAEEEERVATLASALSEYISLAEQAGALEWAASPVTLNGLNTYCTDTLSALESAELLVKQWTGLDKERTERDGELKNLSKALEHARDALLLIEANVPRRHVEAGRHREAVARLAAQLAGMGGLDAGILSEHFDLTLKVALRQAASERNDAQQALQQSRRRLNEFTALREKSLALAQQLRAVAEEILQDATSPDECPLCRTQFGPGELADHIHTGLDAELEATAQALLQRLRSDEAALARVTLLHEQLELLIGFVARAGGPPDMVIKAALKLLDERREEEEKIAAALSRVDTELQELGARDLSYKRFETILDRLERLGHPLTDQTMRGAKALIEKLIGAIEACQGRLQALTGEIEKIQGELNRVLRAAVANIPDARTIMRRDKERVTATQTLLTKLKPFATIFPWPQRSPLADLLVSARSVRLVAAELQTALQREQQKRQASSEALAHKEQLDQRLAQLEPTKERLSAARDTLNELKQNASLTDAMQAALQNNRASIEGIFGRIHAPQEFARLGGGIDRLVRNNGQEAPLAEISTGQRAAFALSIFLARNNQAVSAPPVMLIDDPIAHVDDFNALSFLDYLRALVIKGKRQIFFATANDKIAALFERKFDFLENEFRRFNLTREDA